MPMPLDHVVSSWHDPAAMIRASGSEIAFYEVAATLIPLFMLAGVVFDRLKPRGREKPSRVRKMSIYVPLVGAFAIAAEVIAIGVIVSGNSNLLTRLVVASALSAGMVAVVASVWDPWARMHGWLSPLSAGPARRGAVVALAAVFVFTVVLMEVAASSQSDEESRIEIEEEIGHVRDGLIATEDRITSLSVEAARTSREREVFITDESDCLDLDAFFKEEKKIRDLLHGEGRELDRLILQSINLKNKLDGEPELDKLPSDQFPPTRRQPEIRVPYRQCIAEVERELRAEGK